MNHPFLTLPVVLVLLSCQSSSKISLEPAAEPQAATQDNDNDGYTGEEECDDFNSAINPNAIEICDGLDNDCDGQIDEGVEQIFYADIDGDGFGNNDSTVEACEQPQNHVLVGNDCNDARASVYPGATEECDGIDNNCDGQIDEELLSGWFYDIDGDGYGDPERPAENCQSGEGYAPQGNDCNDNDPSTNPTAPELCDNIDNDCDGQIDEGVQTTYYADQDNDGFGNIEVTTQECSPPPGYVSSYGDCDDQDSERYPGATEVCDSSDNNCDGQIDEDLPYDTFYLDSDGDGYGDANSALTTCEMPGNYTNNDTDCDDSTAAIYPGATEACNQLDDNCDNIVDNNTTDALTWYIDSDGDGYGNVAFSQLACTQPAGYTADATDCNDGLDSVYPGAPETCNQLDDDCDGTTDNNAVDVITYYADGDGDGFGDANLQIDTCSQPTDYVSNNTDCDDSAATVNPNMDEVCDGLDNDCNGTADDQAVDATTWYQDSDGDSYGNPNQSIYSCTQPNNYLSDGTDCDDTNADAYPGAASLEPTLCTYDADADGYGDSQAVSPYDAGSDCDDGEPDVYPNADEICDGLDNDCDGFADDGTAGSDALCAALSCADILDQEPSSSDGVYWIDPASTGAYEAYCDMSTDGGGWTLLLKTSGSVNTQLYYSDALWTNNTLLNEGSVNTNTNSNSKLQPFIDLPITELNGCFPNYSHCIYADLGNQQTAVQLFSGSSLQIGSNFNSQMYSGWSYQTYCRYFGINGPYRTKARFGFSANQENNCNSNDSAIGFGLGNQWGNNNRKYSSGQLCTSWGCSNGNYLWQGFSGLLWGR